MDQPAALQRLIDAYTGASGQTRWAGLPAPGARPVLVGMGASYHAAVIGAHWLAERGATATAGEAAEWLYAGAQPLNQATALVYLSQSGASGEIAPLLDRLPAGVPVIAVTNEEQSPLAQRADFVLPLLAGEEQTVATKTYGNSVALLWLLGWHWAGAADHTSALAGAQQTLQAAQQRQAALLAEGEAVAEHWIERLGSATPLVFLGAGREAVTARQCAMMVMEWLKVPALSSTLGAFRHGPLEIVEAGVGAVLFAAPGRAFEATERLAEELRRDGATVMLVEGGCERTPGEPRPEADRVALAPLVDVVPVQLFVEALARARGLPGEFRRITKVVKQV